jgi:hypothetical protein
MDEKFVIISALCFICVVGFLGIWNNFLGYDPRAIYSSRAPLHKFYGYPIWNIVAFFSFGRMRYKSWKKEYAINRQIEEMVQK